jgi:hypothetical protein
MDRNGRVPHRRPMWTPIRNPNPELELFLGHRARQRQSPEDNPQLCGYSDSDIDKESDEGSEQPALQRRSKPSDRKRVPKPRQHFPPISTGSLRQKNTDSLQERVTSTNHTRSSRAITSGRDAQISPKVDASKYTPNGRRVPVAGHLSPPKRPLTPSSPTCATLSKRPKIGPFENDSSDEDEHMPEKPPLLLNQPQRRLNLELLKDMVTKRHQATIGKSAKTDNPDPTAQTCNRATQKASTANKQVSITTLIPEKRKAEYAGVAPGSRETSVKRARTSVNEATIATTQHMGTAAQLRAKDGGTRNITTTVPSTVLGSTTRLTATINDSSNSTPSATRTQAKHPVNTTSSTGSPLDNKLTPKTSTTRRPGASTTYPTPSITSAPSTRATGAKHPDAPTADLKSAATTGTFTDKPNTTLRLDKPAITLSPTTSAKSPTAKVAPTNNISAARTASRPNQANAQTTTGTQPRAASYITDGRTIPASKGGLNPTSKNTIPATSIAAPPRPEPGNVSGKANGTSAAAHNTVSTKAKPNTTPAKAGHINNEGTIAGNTFGAQPAKAQAISDTAPVKAATDGISLQHSVQTETLTTHRIAQSLPKSGPATRIGPTNTVDGRNNQISIPHVRKQAPTKLTSTSSAEPAFDTRAPTSAKSTAASVISASHTVPGTTLAKEQAEQASNLSKKTASSHKTLEQSSLGVYIPTKPGGDAHSEASTDTSLTTAEQLAISNVSKPAPVEADISSTSSMPPATNIAPKLTVIATREVESETASAPVPAPSTPVEQNINIPEPSNELASAAATSLPASHTASGPQTRNGAYLPLEAENDLTSAKGTSPQRSIIIEAPAEHRTMAVESKTEHLAPPNSVLMSVVPNMPAVLKDEIVFPEVRMEVDSPSPTPKLANSTHELPAVRLKEILLDPTVDPYFEYGVHEKMWSVSDDEHEAEVSVMSGRITCLEEANSRAEQRFAYVSKEDAKYKLVKFSEWNNTRDRNDCMSYVGIFAPIDFPDQKTHHKIWVERHVVCATSATVQPPRKNTQFISKAVYILRLFKLVDDPNHAELPASDDEGAAAESSSSDSDSESSSESDSDPDKGKYNKKANARKRPSITPARESRSAPVTHSPIRQHHPIPKTSEIYTTLAYANRAARRLQIELSHEKDTSSPLSRKWQEQNRRELEERVLALEAEDMKDGGGFWRSEFNGCGRGGDRFELVVERTALGGPKNI